MYTYIRTPNGVGVRVRTYRRGLRCCLFEYKGNSRASISGTATVQSRFFCVGMKTIMNMKRTITYLYNRFRHLILYGIIGGFCATLDLGIYTLLCHFDILHYLWGNVFSIHCGIICSFLLNRTFNFKVKDKTAQRFLSFYVVGIIGLGISELMLYLMVTVGNWNEVLCKLISVIVVALIQFVLNKYITFNTQQS